MNPGAVNIVTALIAAVSGLIGGLGGAILTKFLNRDKTDAEIKKLIAETQKIHTEIEVLSSRASKTEARLASEAGNLLLPYKPRYELFLEAPILIDTVAKKPKIAADFLRWGKLSMVFWVEIRESFSWSDNNRYIFAQTSDPRDAGGYPNGFYMGVVGNSGVWRLVVKAQDPVQSTEIKFPSNPSFVGWRMISIRWSRHTHILELDFDAGRVLSEKREIEPSHWPIPDINDQLNVGGWLDFWSGGLSLLRFYRFRLYDVRFSDQELKHLYEQEKEILNDPDF